MQRVTAWFGHEMSEYFIFDNDVEIERIVVELYNQGAEVVYVD